MQNLKKLATIGSQRLLQLAVNRQPDLLRLALREAGVVEPYETIVWKSPLDEDKWAEYRDRIAFQKLEIEHKLKTPLLDFWPRGGPVWDGLGVTSLGNPILVEAKAHIPEAASPGTQATPNSRQLIEKSLAATRRYLAPKSKAIWSGTFYQYANRLAFQYYLRILNNIDSRLVFLDFTNAADMDGPTTKEEWVGASRMIHAVLGLPASLDQFHVYHAFIDAGELTG